MYSTFNYVAMSNIPVKRWYSSPLVTSKPQYSCPFKNSVNLLHTQLEVSKCRSTWQTTYNWCLKLKNKKKWKKFKRKKPIPYYIGIQIWILLLCQQLHKCDKHNQDRPSRKKNDHILPHLLLCVHQLKDWHQYPSMNLN